MMTFVRAQETTTYEELRSYMTKVNQKYNLRPWLGERENFGDDHDNNLICGESLAMLSPTTKILQKMVDNTGKRLDDNHAHDGRLSSKELDEARKRMIATIDNVCTINIARRNM